MPIGPGLAVDMLAFAAMQLMAVRIGATAGTLALGGAVTRLAIAAMAVLGLTGVLAMSWIEPDFVSAGDPAAAAVCALCVPLAGPAMLFQALDGWKPASNCCLMGVGDVRIPAFLATVPQFAGSVPVK